MASRKRKRLSVWGVLGRLGLTGDRDDIIEHVFTTASRQTFRGDDGEPLDGDDYLVGVFESLGATKDWPGCGTPEWERLRTVALRKVVARLARDGLLDCVSVGSGRTPAPSGTETGKPTDGERGGMSAGTDARDGECERDGETPATKGDESDAETPAAGDEGSEAVDVNVDGDEAQSGKDDSPDPRTGVEVFMAILRRGKRNPEGWFRGVDRSTPYRVIARWAAETCPGASAESLAELMDRLREVRWWDNDGHIQGAEMLRALESELEAGRDNEEWMLVVSDFEDVIQRLRSVFEKLCLL